MTQFGYTAMCEQAPARQLVSDLVAAELAGFDFSVTSDHFFPWIEGQGHAPNAWVVLGAAAQATEGLPPMTFVTCPTFRYHPVVVAQQAATLSVFPAGGSPWGCRRHRPPSASRLRDPILPRSRLSTPTR